MADRPTITTVAAGKYSTSQLNSNFQALRDAFDALLGTNGTSGDNNSMSGDLDMNGNALRNVTFDAAIAGLSWEGDWVTATAYVVNDLVKSSGNVYICIVAHTSGTFSTDLTAAKWELFASKGDTGASGVGSGDLVSTNNLSDVTNAATALSNLGGASTATTITAGTGLTGGGSLAANRTISADIASQVEAEAGTSSTKLMTPERVSQAITALSPAAGIGAVTVQAFTATSTWTRPTGVKYVRAVVVAGGGGGAGAESSAAGGSGGGAGGFSEKVIDVQAIASVAVTVGAGGTAGNTTPTSGGTGGTSSFGAHCSATGGVGGTNGTNAAGGTGGAGSSGDVNTSGGQGGRCVSAASMGGDGGASFFGGGGQGGISTVAGVAGQAYGSGGGGGGVSGAVASAGGAGKAGIVIVYEYR